jgi:hypothetical protein
MGNLQKTTPPIIDKKNLGYWTNTWNKSSEIKRFRLFLEGYDLWMEIADQNYLDSGSPNSKAKVKSYTSSPESNIVIALEAKFDLKDMTADMSINFNKGILIIACFHNYKEGEEGTNYFTRQFYSRVGGCNS